jgi:hypothetical protein|tara:strand:+ start:784 stop:1107 length:324 start_codon:yes stop_codon:yes gene_type:complete
MTISYIKPECSPFYYNEKGEKIYQKNKNRKGIAYCSDGFLLPCCWCDTIGNGDFRARGFKDDKMKLENNEVSEIISSDVWKQFMYSILHEPDHAPFVCIKKCGVHDE